MSPNPNCPALLGPRDECINNVVGMKVGQHVLTVVLTVELGAEGLVVDEQFQERCIWLQDHNDLGVRQAGAGG